MIKINISLKHGYTKDDIFDAVLSVIPISKSEINDFKILKRAINITDNGVSYKMTVALSLPLDREVGLLKMRKKVSEYKEEIYYAEKATLKSRPIIVGSGPCGLFCALALAESGTNPIILERGECVEDREKSVNSFFTLGILNPESNVQFGEGGAGTYSDGKLKVGAYDKFKNRILNEFVEAGASADILYSDSAHLGTDKLSGIVKKIREKIISLGGEFIFSARLISVLIKEGRVCGAKYIKGETEYELSSDTVILATGHSARDVFYMLKDMGVPMTAKGFGVGLRIEHPREYINKIVYKGAYSNELESASYHLVTHLNNGRSVYSFCMCPGGTVVSAASECGRIVTNGMSEYMRDADNSNAALLVSVTPEDFGGSDALLGIEFQRRIEKRAYNISSSYKAPAIRLDNFLSDRACGSFNSVTPSYALGTVDASPSEYLPSYLTDSLKEGICDFDKWLSGYNYGDAVLTGPETRTTSPVRILRGDSYEVLGFFGLYAAGEGAGYAGGIISSATDGIKVADAIISRTRTL